MHENSHISASDPVEHGVGLCLDPAGPNETKAAAKGSPSTLDEIDPRLNKGRKQVRAALFTIDPGFKRRSASSRGFCRECPGAGRE